MAVIYYQEYGVLLLNSVPLPALNMYLWMLPLTCMAFVKTVTQRGRQVSETGQQVEAPAAPRLTT